MPTIVIEGPRLSLSKKRALVRELTALVASAYNWPAENIVVILRENSDENVARGGRLLIDRAGLTPPLQMTGRRDDVDSGNADTSSDFWQPE